MLRDREQTGGRSHQQQTVAAADSEGTSARKHRINTDDHRSSSGNEETDISEYVSQL